MESILSQIWCFGLLLVHLQGDGISFYVYACISVHIVGWEEELQKSTMSGSKSLHC